MVGLLQPIRPQILPTTDNKLELVVEVDVNRANASIKSVNAGLTAMEATAVKAARGASSGIDGLTVSVAKGAAAAGVLASAFERVVGWVRTQIEETSRLAARNETLAVVNAQLARANGYNEGSVERLVTRIKDLGITTQASRDIVNKMIAAQLDLSKATDLARLAQDAAVVAGQDSSAALQGIMSGITTQQIEVLRTYGINIQFERAFTEARRRLGRDMTEIERRNTALNVVLAEGPKIAGCQGRSKKLPPGRSKRGPFRAVLWVRVICVLGPAGASALRGRRPSVEGEAQAGPKTHARPFRACLPTWSVLPPASVCCL